MSDRDRFAQDGDDVVVVDKDRPLVVVHEHGELGPILADPEHDFAGPSDVSGPHGPDETGAA